MKILEKNITKTHRNAQKRTATHRNAQKRTETHSNAQQLILITTSTETV